MIAQNPENGCTPCSTLNRKASRKLLLEQLDQMERTRWETLLRLQQEKLDQLASLIETKTLSTRGSGPDLSVLAHHRNAQGADRPAVGHRLLHVTPSKERLSL